MRTENNKFIMKQSEYLNAIDRAKERASSKDHYYTKHLEDEISELKRREKFWTEKYFNLKREMGLFFPKGNNK